ncbi:phage baseplate assembly protein V [Myxococcus sp. K15C18031901]|uniref:phage baseplate assembly protein V n=1 Tax=Myxococcus dinghuensis TaxID=2906761 RepID=UPI0020A7D03C|nr:phage baseplate assembly protein V [Myxococcus dinghuensis]MCP3099517.1 phage baseplate assembly protein V [Myxococcus dinghuensis]
MSDLVTIIRAIIRDELASLRMGDIGVVTSAFPHADGDAHNHECHVKLRESGLELRRVPIATPHIGMVSAPHAGDLVVITYIGGDPNRPIITGRLYSDTLNPPVHEADEWRVVSPPGGKTSIAIDQEQSIVLTAGETVVTVKQDDVITIKGKTDLSLEVEGNVQLKCTDCTVDASGKIDLGKGGSGVITEMSHKCYFTGAPLKGSKDVKAK